MSFDWLKHYMPRGLYARAALILVLPVVVLQLVVSSAFIQRHLEDVTSQMSSNVLRELRTLLEVVDRTQTQDQASASAAPFLTAFGMKMRFVSAHPTEDINAWYDYSARVVRHTLRRLATEVRFVHFLDDRRVYVFLDSAQGPMEVSFSRRLVTAAAPHQLIVTMIFFGGLMTVIAFLYMRNQLRPITRLAEAAQAFGRGRVLPYNPAGATEVRAAGNAFLDMRARIERQIEQRTLMLSGVSHDMRTPITRLKLGLSMMEEDEAEPLLRDVSEMEGLLEAFLDFSKGASEGQVEPVDPLELVRQIHVDAARSGKPVRLGDMVGQGEVMLRPLAMRRAIENLLGNALRYGDQAEISVVLTDKSLRIRVEDDGPGIPAEQRSEALKPFTRLDPARNQDRGSGVGLGLAIVTDIARAHGGVLRLGHSEAMGGLRADIVIAC
jgi:two-component system osmolarity sensor histidine kinase EnvZ